MVRKQKKGERNLEQRLYWKRQDKWGNGLVLGHVNAVSRFWARGVVSTRLVPALGCFRVWCVSQIKGEYRFRTGWVFL